MCFSNLPIEFDDEGNPYLAEEADEVDEVPASGCGCGADAEDTALEDADPEAMVDDILETMPRSVRERIVDAAGEQCDSAGAKGDVVEELGDAEHRDSAEGD